MSAAASLTFAFQELGERFRHETGTRVGLNFGSSGQLAQQIASGAPVDLFAAANMAFLDDLDRQGVLLAETKRPYARGRLTLWTRADSPLRFVRLEDVMRPEVRRLALANPSHAPYGVAAREALQAVGLWDKIQSKLVLGENVRQALQYAATGNVDVALVARSLSVQHEGRWVVLPARARNRPGRRQHRRADLQQPDHGAGGLRSAGRPPQDVDRIPDPDSLAGAPSALLLANQRPSELKARPVTSALWPDRENSNRESCIARCKADCASARGTVSPA